MEEYINKTDLVAKIRKRLLPVIRDKHYDEWEEGRNSECIAILDIINTLEVKNMKSSWSEDDVSNLRRVEFAVMKFFGGDTLLIGWLRKNLATLEVDLKQKSFVKIDRKLLFEICDAILEHDGYSDVNDCPENDSECFCGKWDEGFRKKVENIRRNS